MKLVLHRGAEQIDRTELASLWTPMETRSYKPLPHETFMALIEQGLADAGLTVNDTAFGIHREKGHFFGVLSISSGESDWTSVIGARNSHDKRFPAGICLGSRVFVCDNLAFNAEVVFNRRHTVNLFRDLPGMVNRGIGRLVSGLSDDKSRFERYKNRELSPDEADCLIMRAFRDGALPVTGIAHVDREYRNPRHEEFKGRSVWSLFNAFTEVYKGDNPFADLPERSRRLTTLMDGFCGLSLNRETVELN
jgi:hypothetical protein